MCWFVFVLVKVDQLFMFMCWWYLSRFCILILNLLQILDMILNVGDRCLFLICDRVVVDIEYKVVVVLSDLF